MPHLHSGTVRQCRLLLVLILFTATLAVAQFETATVSGQVSDPSGLSVSGARVDLVDIDRGTSISATSNNSGLYRFTSVQPGRYRMEVRAPGFRVINFTGLTVNVQDHLEQNFRLTVGSVSESVTVEGGAPLIDTESGTVSTVVDRQFADNLPMNGRSFQTLIQLTPGVVLVSSNADDGGQFSVNGQRGAANYWMVDGVSANIGVGAVFNPGNGFSGALPSFSVQGGTNSLVSVDALQEFRIQTSTYAPEFGRTPGSQISIVTRSGTNRLHGTVFDYFRNDALDANDWFAGASHLAKPQERQNDFGGTFSGPVLKDRTFFFFSYEGLRLRLPQVGTTFVPSIAARQSASPAAQPFLNAFPLPDVNASDNSGVSTLTATYSNRSSLDAYSLRVDDRLRDNLTLFGRYNYSPSSLVQRGFSVSPLNDVGVSNITTQTGTAGATWLISPTTTDDLRFNYSRTSSNTHAYLDSFGGAVPLTSLPFPSPFTSVNGQFVYLVFSLNNNGMIVGPVGDNLQRQINIVDSVSLQKGSHSMRVGVDFRRLSPLFGLPGYGQEGLFFDVPSAQSGNSFLTFVLSGKNGNFIFHNLGAFAQDTWRILPRLTVTYGLRWDVDFAPDSSPGLLAVTNFNVNDLSSLAVAPLGTAPFKTQYGNIAPRIGIAYQLSNSQAWQTVLRGGFGIFFDLATSEVGNNVHSGSYPFGATATSFGGAFPPTGGAALPPAITLSSGLSSGTVYVYDPNLKLPYSLQWNVALEQALGSQQTISASYIGSAGRRLLQSAYVNSPNPTFAAVQVTANTAVSAYGALQLQFQRRLSHGLQALSSYTLSHSIDTASAGSVFGNYANALVPGINRSANRGPSDFDVRNAFSAGVTYDIPAPSGGTFANTVLHGWSLENVIQVRSAPPVDVYDSLYSFGALRNAYTLVRPDVIPGLPLYLYGSQYPGGKIFNNTLDPSRPGCVGSFCPPPTNANGVPLRQGDLPRNALRGFGTLQWDLAVHRDFAIRELLRLQFRAELFNVLNHPNFGPPIADINNTAQFGQSTQMLGRSLDNFNQGGGSFSSLYQIGGPRSIQLALKLQF